MSNSLTGVNPDYTVPSYINSYKNGSLKKAIDILYNRLSACDICPRNCKVNRLKNNKGFCKTGLKAGVYSYFSHYGEEPAISGRLGSGTIFFSNCNLACAYCQNYKFSQLNSAREVREDELAGFMLELQKKGCHNINFVTPSHVIPQILKALYLACKLGLKIPLVYNTSGYDSLDSLKLLDKIFDIYLPDARYAQDISASKYSKASDYVQVNKLALIEMHKQAGPARLDNEGIIKSGLIIRHLVLPGHIQDTQKILKFISQKLGKGTYISLMSQYYPYYKAKTFPEISRRINDKEYKQAKKIMLNCGLHNGWTQDKSGLDKLAGIHFKSNV